MDPLFEPESPPDPRAAVMYHCGYAALKNLSLYKWRYTLETAGFTHQQAAYLVFTRWRLQREHITPQLAGRYSR